MKGIFSAFMGLLLFSIISAVVLGSTIDCQVVDRGTCSGTSIIQLSSENNAHAAELSNSYSKELCCYTPGPTNSLRVSKNPTTVPDDALFIFSTDGNKNAMVSSSDIFSEKYYIYDSEGGKLVCKTDSSCNGDWGCIIQTEENNDWQHASQCSGDFDTTRCCKLLDKIKVNEWQIKEKTEEGSVQPSENAIVEFRDANYKLIKSIETNSDGSFDSPIYLSSGLNITVYIKKPGYIAIEKDSALLYSDSSISKVLATLEEGQPCQSDCTREGSEYCDPTCVGINGCTYDPSYTTNLFGETSDVMDVCKMQKKGWVKKFDETKYVECCNSTPFVKSELESEDIKVGKGVEDVKSYEIKTILRKGKLVTLHLSMWQD
ncbi:MAG: hypothetical protein ACQESF_02110 [Nanobdellota archaeon]